MKLKRDLHLEISRKLQNSVSVKIFAFRADRGDHAERVCLGSLHMPETYLRVFRLMLESGNRILGGHVSVGGSYFGNGASAGDDVMLTPSA
jgi:hypothetical protein